MVDDTQKVEDAEIVVENENADQIVEDTITEKPSATDVLDLTSLINRYVADIEKLKEQVKTQREMIKSAFENDKEYYDKDQVVKKATKDRNAVKQRIMKTPAVEAASAKMEELSTELKDMQLALSGYLQEHMRVTGQNTIEGEDGELREIVPVYRLVKRKV